VADASGALVGRFVILRQTQSWFGQEDTALTGRLLKELPGILLWAIVGWQRLQARGRFVQPEASLQMIADLGDLASPIGAFVRERCRVDAVCTVSRGDLFAEWKRWCEGQGREHPGDIATFGRNLRAAVPSIGDAQHRVGDGKRERIYEGIGLK
jgi:putative DNA primase/helicase